MSQKGLTFMVLLFWTLLGGAVFCLGCYWAVLGHQATSWAEVSGTLINVKVHTGRVKGAAASGVSVVYTYDYKGKQYEGRRVAFGGSGNQLSAGYAPGTQVSVWVDPQMPSRSVLLPGVMSGSKVFIVLGCLILLFSLIMVRPVLRYKPLPPG